MISFFKKLIILFIIISNQPIYAIEEEQPSNKHPFKNQEIIELDITKDEEKKKEQGKNSSNDWIQKDTPKDNTDTEFSIFDNLIDTDKESQHPFKIEEESLFGRIYKKDIERTSIPSFLLKDELTLKYEKGPIDKVQFYGAYQGNTSFNFKDSDFDTNYGFGFAEAGLIGDFKDKYTNFKLQFNFKEGENRSYLQGLITDAYFMNTRIPHHRIIIGNSRNQVGFEGGMSSYVLPFITRSQIARTFGNTRALGTRIVGNYDLIDYSFALNSSDRFFKDFFPGGEFTGWVNLKPLGKTNGKFGEIILGGGISTGKNTTDYTVAGAYASYRYKKFMANFEYSHADGYNGIYLSTNKAEGFYTTLIYRLTKKLHLLARYDWFDPNKNTANNNREEYSIGLNYYIKGQAVRLILNYIFCNNDNAKDSHKIMLGTQFLL